MKKSMGLGVALMAFGVAASGLSANPASASVPAAGTFASQPGDYIGQGQPITVTDFVARKYGQAGIQLWSAGSTWNILITPPPGQTLAPGTYTTRRMGTDKFAGLDMGGAGRGCNTSTGTLWIDDLAFDSTGDPSRIGIRIEQHCEGMVPAMYGSVVSSGAAVNPVQLPVAPPTPPPAPPTVPPTMPVAPVPVAPVAPPTQAPVASVTPVAPPAAPPAQPRTYPTDLFPSDPTPVKNFATGSCAGVRRVGSGGLARLFNQSCGKPHQYEVVGSWRNAFGSYSDISRRESICAQAFSAYVRSYPFESRYSLMVYFPSTNTWQMGDRGLVCLAGSGSGSGTLKPGSVKGSGA